MRPKETTTEALKGHRDNMSQGKAHKMGKTAAVPKTCGWNVTPDLASKPAPPCAKSQATLSNMQGEHVTKPLAWKLRENTSHTCVHAYT